MQNYEKPVMIPSIQCYFYLYFLINLYKCLDIQKITQSRLCLINKIK